ncbi:methyl-accepting chemotaxis protein [Caldimonas tepidiphila]|uniref:methyl-accepting chemotaxis protein n=1 Tax=Caldimonas tepidiphila TaxID=2315841 RepID=UPI0014755B73|nr:methyl-accepting chemotaxis protein [Caldimonas tepidiphila]
MKNKESRSPALAMRTRLLGVGLLCLLAAAVPTGLLVAQDRQESRLLERQREALPLARAVQHSVAALGEHRSATALVPSRQEAGRARQQESGQQLLLGVEAAANAIAANPALGSPLSAEIQAIEGDARELVGASASPGTEFGTLMERHRALADRILALQTAGMAATGLLFERDAATHLGIAAGLQKAPRVGDALSEMVAIAVAARIDDVGGISAAFARYEGQVRELAQLLTLASRAEPGLAARHAPVLQQIEAQQRSVAETVQAAMLDVNFPLDEMVRSLTGAMATHAGVSGEVLQILDTELALREERLAARRLALVAGLGLLWVFVAAMLWNTLRAILGPTLSVLETTERIAAGDLSGNIAKGRNDEMGRILGGLERMQSQLHGVVAQIQASATGVRAIAADIASGNQHLSERTAQAASRLQEAASAVERMAVAVGQSADGAREAHALAEAAARTAQDGGAAVSEMVRSMQAIHGTSTRIGEIVGVIDGLAFQTNLLALNAAVEAARAGPQGRGFAVVAAEVRTLAQRSAQSAREIRDLVQAATERIEHGGRTAERAGRSIESLVGRVEQVRATLGDIAAAAQQQSAGMSQVNAAVAELDRVTRQNAALVGESALAAQTMREQAEGMSRLAAVFRLARA